MVSEDLILGQFASSGKNTMLQGLVEECCSPNDSQEAQDKRGPVRDRQGAKKYPRSQFQDLPKDTQKCALLIS